MIDILNIEPHEVSSDLSGYAIGVYGSAGLGKTTVALKSDKSLLFAAEKGYKSLAGTMAVDINSWTNLLTAVAQIKNPQVQERYKTIVIDTLDELVFYGEQYVLQANNVSKPSEIAYGGFYVQIEQMFRKLFKDITQHYGLVIVAHADLKLDEDDPEKKLKYATLTVNKRVKKIVIGLLDLLVYVEGDRSKPGVTIAHYKSSPYWEAKSRFPHIVESNIFNYENLKNDILHAIGDNVTNKTHKQYITEEPSYTQADFETIKAEVEKLGMSLVESKGLGVVSGTINSVLGKKIGDTDIGDVAALRALKAEFESM